MKKSMMLIMTIAVRTNLSESQVAGLLRKTVAGLNQQVPLGEVKTMAAVVTARSGFGELLLPDLADVFERDDPPRDDEVDSP